MKYLLLLAFLAAVWWVWSKRQASAESDAARPRDPLPEKMVTCAHCGVHLPESEGIAQGDQIYCSEAHRLAASTMER